MNEWKKKKKYTNDKFSSVNSPRLIVFLLILKKGSSVKEAKNIRAKNKVKEEGVCVSSFPPLESKGKG